jgi:acetyl-CoA carboxylase biotin carboxyl carrier protein
MGNDMDMNEINSFIDRIEKSPFEEASLEVGDVKISLKKKRKPPVGQPPMGMPPMGMPPMVGPWGNVPAAANGAGVQAGAGAAGVEPEAGNAAAISGAAVDAGLSPVKAPLVGTFYRSASPEEKPFVIIGQEVKKGDVIGIIEAMKLMNEIKAGEDGVVESIDAEDGQMVEYNQTLVTIRKS